MKKFAPLSTLIILLLLSLKSFSQFSSEQRNVTRPDLTTNTYLKDSTANALVIYEFGNSYVDKKTYKLETEIIRKIKIFNRKGFDEATITIPLYYNSSDKERIVDIEASTYNLVNDELIKTSLNEKDIFEEQYNDKFKLTKFTLPDIQEGSVIVYSYKLISPFFFNYKEWDFQSDIPKLYSEYNTSIPANWTYNIKLIGEKKLKVNDSKIEHNCLEGAGGAYSGCSVNKYVMTDIPAFKEEKFLTAKSNYLSRIEYELMTFQDFQGVKHNYAKTWDTADREIESDGSIGRQLSKTSAVKNLLPAEISGISDPQDKAKAIYKFVIKNYVWNNQIHLFKGVSVKDVVDKKSGNSSELNILLHNILDLEGFEVYPVLISTRSNGIPTTLFPVISEFNYLIVCLNISGKVYFLDATDPYLAFGNLPFKALNHLGRLLDFKNGSRWVDIMAQDYSHTNYRLEGNLSSEGTLSGKLSFTNTGYNALSPKHLYFENESSYLNKMEEKHENVKFLSHQTEIKEKSEYQFNDTFEIEIKPEVVGNNVYIDAFPIKFFTENPFKLEERTYPVDFGYKDIYSCWSVFNFDSTYRVSEIPEKLTYSLPNNLATVIVDWQANESSVRCYMKLNFNQSLYSSTVYQELKELFSKVVQSQNNSYIILEKI